MHKHKASSAESVGKYWFQQITKGMIQGCLQAFQRFITISFSHSQFCFKVKPLNRAGRKSAIGLEPVENEMLVFAQPLRHLFYMLLVYLDFGAVKKYHVNVCIFFSKKTNANKHQYGKDHSPQRTQRTRRNNNNF